jgi:hypothetical protein
MFGRCRIVLDAAPGAKFHILYGHVRGKQQDAINELKGIHVRHAARLPQSPPLSR